MSIFISLSKLFNWSNFKRQKIINTTYYEHCAYNKHRIHKYIFHINKLNCLQTILFHSVPFHDRKTHWQEQLTLPFQHLTPLRQDLQLLR